MKALVEFVGAGPGAEDLITVRGARLLGEADVVIYAARESASSTIRFWATLLPGQKLCRFWHVTTIIPLMGKR